MDGLNKAVATLDLEHARLARMPVWPWSAATLRGLLTAVFLPLPVWATQQFLLRMFQLRSADVAMRRPGGWIRTAT